jgi:hypothetical protein
LAWAGASALIPGQVNDRPALASVANCATPVNGYCQATSFAQMVNINAGRGSAFFEFDLRTTKTFDLGSETRKLNLFVELYNLTDRANFGGNYNGTVTNAAFRQPLNFFNNGITNANSRQLQLGARFTF